MSFSQSLVKGLMKALVGGVVFAGSLSAQAENYCMAIRGNGELMPAHWGAMAQTIESFGLPIGVAGGSSASISSFLLESIALNSLVQESSGADQARIASFLVKSMQGYSYAMASNPQWTALLEFTQMLGTQNPNVNGSLQRIEAILTTAKSKLTARQVEDLAVAFNDIRTSQVFSGPALAKLLMAIRTAQAQPSEANTANIQVQFEQVRNSLAVFGKFDAKNDDALFFRDGVVNFNALGKLFGKMAAFYAMKDASSATKASLKNLVQKCSPNTAGKLWKEIVAQNPDCQHDLGILARNYFDNEGKNSTRIHENVGSGIHALITTSVVIGNSRRTLQDQKEAYDKTHDVAAAKIVNVNPNDIRFGYWGQAADLKQAEKVLTDRSVPQLAKSKKFLNLGETTWEVALSTSPAEPGLSTFNKFTTASGEELLSLGGWSDLHPVPVLKAIGCEKVVYLTRKGGDTVFGQGVAKRLFQLSDSSITWADLDSKNKASAALNDAGHPNDQTSVWSSMYNLANPNSSYAASVKAADVVVCTNWNSFDIKKDFTRMIEDAYVSPMYIARSIELSGLKSPTEIKAADNVRNADGAPVYAGCIPLQ